MKKLLYTCITGNYDTIKKHVVGPDWDLIYLKLSGDVLLAREKKIICPFWDEYDLSVWVDGHISTLVPIQKVVNRYHKNEFTLMKHPVRNCIYQEAAECILQKKDNPDTILRQIARYQAEKYPFNNGLVATGIIIRNHNDRNYNFCKEWLKELKNGSCRDQLSFNYVAHKLGFEYDTFDYVDQIPEFKKFKHDKR